MSDSTKVSVTIGEPTIISRTPAPETAPTAPGFWGTAEADLVAVKDWVGGKVDAALTWRDDVENNAIDAYSKSAVSEAIDKSIALEQKAADKVGGVLDFATDPKQMQQLIDSLKWLAIAGAVGYGLYLLTPVVRGAR